MSDLRISLLGPFQVWVNDRPAHGFLSDKVRALLAYLAMEQSRPFRREALAGLLWPEQSEQKARANLRRALANLRQVIDDQNGRYLRITRQTLQFNSDCDAPIDALCFCQQLATPHPTIAQREEAISYVNGRFLEGFFIHDSLAFEEWVLLKREQLQQQILDCLNQLTRYYEQQRHYDQALHFAWKQVQLEPWHESGQRQLLRLLTYCGQRGTAVAHFERFQEELDTELGIIPEPETIALINQIRDGSFVVDDGKHPPISAHLRTAVSEQLPGHFMDTTHWQKEIVEQQLAGNEALQHSANEDAIIHFRQALAFIEHLPVTAVRDQQEVDLQIALGTALLALKGYADLDVKAVFDRARDLHTQMVPDLQMFISLFWLSSYYAVSGDLEAAHILGQQMVDITKITEANRLHEVMAHVLTGVPLFFMGLYSAALHHFAQAIAAYEPTVHREIAAIIGQDPGISAHIWAGHTLCHLGQLQAAETHLTTALTLLDGLDHPHTAVFTHLLAGGTPYTYYLPNHEKALPHLQQAMDIATVEHFSYLQNLTQFYIMYMRVQQILNGSAPIGGKLLSSTKSTIRSSITKMKDCIQQELQIGAQLGMTSRYILLADLYGRMHDTETAATLLTHANALVYKNHERYFEPELHRVQAYLHYVNDNPAAVQRSLQKAIAIAQKQDAHLWAQKATDDLHSVIA